MKLKLAPRTFQIYWDVHAWSGVLAALLLHVMFFMGAFALFQHELDAWANPIAGAASGTAAPGHTTAAAPLALQPLLAQLDREQPLIGKRRVAFLLEPTGLRAYWDAPKEHHELYYSAASGRLEPVRSELGSFLYSLHYLGPFPSGIYVAGVAALALLLALSTGLFIQLKDLRRHWFLFRAQRDARTWSSDMHKVLGVFGLPYQLLYAWTGALLSLSFATVQPAFVATLFGGDAHAASAARGDEPDPPERTGRTSGKLPDLDALLARARLVLPELKPSWVGIEHVGDEHSSVSIFGAVSELPFGSASVLLNAADGAVLGVTPARAGAFQRFEAWFFGLHYARFGGYGVKLLYALLALASCAVIVTGNLIWLERRDRRRQHWGNRCLERLTAGWCAGLVLATSSLFLANRLLQGMLPVSTGTEQLVFWSTWAAAIAGAFLARARQVAALELLLSGVLLAGAVGLDLMAAGPARRDPLHQAVNMSLLLFALAALAGGARLLRRRMRSRDSARPLAELPHWLDAQ
jgi:uncharacterized iron-regulated membrane protein